jgi:CheY-like chemotaxis protein
MIGSHSSAAVTTGAALGTADASSSAPAVLLIADDDEVTRSGLRMLLAAQPGIAVVGEAADGVEAVERARKLRPDVVLMDVRMPRPWPLPGWSCSRGRSSIGVM